MLAEFNTHRMFSRNSASSRAIPFNKMVKMVQENPFIPIAFQQTHRGMQGTEYLTGQKAIDAKQYWLSARNEAVESAIVLANNDITKQLCNRLLEPFMWHTVIVTATEWNNFFNLRCPAYTHVSDKLDGTSVTVFKSKKDYEHCYGEQGFSALEWLKINTSQADIHIQAIAELMWNAINESVPKQLRAGEYHIPFGDNINLTETQKYFGEDSYKIKIATARCARISFQTLGDNPKIDHEADIRLHDMLVESCHWSPFEHVAKAMTNQEYYQFRNGWLDNTSEEVISQSAGWCRNFRGFIQYRALIDN
jgi:thymidylate synthase ThyX